MRKRTKEMFQKVKSALMEADGYLSAGELASKYKLSVVSIYSIIRKLRLAGVGIIPTKKGYVLSAYAKKNDDVYFLRRLHGQRTWSYIALRAAEPDIRHRWRGMTAKNELKLLTAPLHVELGKLTDVKEILNKYEDK